MKREFNKFETYGCLALSLISVFTLGAYTYATLHGKPVELYRWALTGFFGFMFFIGFLENHKNV